MKGIDFFRILRETPGRTVNHPPKSVLYELAKADLQSGVSPAQIERLKKELEEEEHFEACAGLQDALNELSSPS